ncbi:MAG: helix-turn-helix domain-containing protein [Bifidobacteriaceae bacterium]|jgi:excisionase family DNA binding protein|nr:helix-turn-helix domain-containing protein [Bifidobacteriaceae bacterium]
MASNVPAPRPRFLTVAEVADHMRVSGMTVYRLIHAGGLRAVRVGRSFRVPQDAVEEFLAAAGDVRQDRFGT